MQLYLIRHAQSTNNALADERHRVSDPPLTELGERQSEILAWHLAEGRELEPSTSEANNPNQRGYGITRLYCSPMWRALQTAYFIGQALRLTSEVWVDLHEKGGIYLDDENGRGPVGYPGRARREIQAAFPDYVLPEGITEHGWWNREYEDWPACHERASRVANELRQWPPSDERVVLVSHGGFMDALLKALFKQSPDRHLFYYHYNTAISRVDFQSDGNLGVHYLNRMSHLPLELIS
jgi:broad specificity phosphatase PhoE